MEIAEIKALSERQGTIQIIVTFIDEDHIDVGAKILKPGFLTPTYGDYVMLHTEDHTGKKIKQAAEQLLTQLDNMLKEM